MKKVVLLNIITLLSGLNVLISCGENRDISIKTAEDGSVSICFEASAKYLILPVEDRGEERKIVISVAGKQEDTYIVRLAKTKPDYLVPLELSDWKGKEITITVPDKSAICLSEVKLSDTFEVEQAEKYRPGYHFTPPYGWMNDPNGMVYYNGEYHLFYQYNPFGTRWQNMSWGHAVSKDLIRWEHLPVALRPDSLGTIFSGSAVVDINNTAGFQTGNEKTLLAFYTQSERGGQWQSLAYSNDKGRSWTKYNANPVLKHASARDFRDPKVFWYKPLQRWIMVLAVGQAVEIYSSADAKKWTYESDFGAGYGAHTGVWECPDLFELQVQGTDESKWVLLVNLSGGTQYFTGIFDGKNFVCENPPGEIHWMDYGSDHYATVTWSDIPGNRRVAIAWMCNPGYAGDVPTQNFRSAMSIPRELKLIQQGSGYRLTSYPVEETGKLRGSKTEYAGIRITKDEYSLDNLLQPNEGRYELLIDLDAGSADTVGFVLSDNDKSGYIKIYISRPEGKIFFDRTHSGNFSDRFSGIIHAPIAKKESYRLRLLVDNASVECFEGNGEISITNVIFPYSPYNRIGFYAGGGEYTVKKLEIYPLK
ncbi:MAG: GH32 C-terminal domain-containing protein [Prevotellaceae bacterium]|jgi:fructan beta-fructosidase|nr:GH32 C-terminal domain-containing protein [Prevotellaceae bacterium]